MPFYILYRAIVRIIIIDYTEGPTIILHTYSMMIMRPAYPSMECLELGVSGPVFSLTWLPVIVNTCKQKISHYVHGGRNITHILYYLFIRSLIGILYSVSLNHIAIHEMEH